MITTNGKIGGYDYTEKDWQWYKGHLGIKDNTSILSYPSIIKNPENIFITTSGEIFCYKSTPPELLVNMHMSLGGLEYENEEFRKPCVLLEPLPHSDIDSGIIPQGIW